MIIEIKEKPSDKQPWALDIEEIKIGFVVGDEECQYDYDTEKYIGEKPFEKLYTGEEYVKISCDGEYAYPEFLQMWNGFIKQYKIQEITDTEKVEEIA